MPGILYIVPTPIGNLEDITLRALTVLKSVDLIACEDTRQTVKILNHFGFQKPLLSFFTHNQLRRVPELLADLKSGKNVALVSDCGTPGISDPGWLLISAVIKDQGTVIPLPGPSAVTTALIGSGLPTDGFVFLGFLRRKPGKMKKELERAAGAGKTLVFYESPYRVKKTLEICEHLFGPAAPAALARELTKKFEEFVRGPLGEVRRRLEEREILGECVIMIHPGGAVAGPENGMEEDADGE